MSNEGNQKLTINVVGENLLKNSKSLEEVYAKISTMQKHLCPQNEIKAGCCDAELKKEPDNLLDKLYTNVREQTTMINTIDIAIQRIMDLYL